MSSTVLLDEVLERGEQERGSIEFKQSLSRGIHLDDEKRSSLVSQMRYRVLSGNGSATYVVGVDDDGNVSGLSEDEFEETLEVLEIISDEADVSVESVERQYVEQDGVVALVAVESEEQESRDEHVLVGTAGHVDHGKSTLVGSLVTGKSDDGAGQVRGFLDVKPHEVERGLSADLSYAVYGFDKDDDPMKLDNPDRKGERSAVVEQSEKLVSFVDTVGHEPWLRTTIRGLVGQKLDYGLLTIAADDGPTKTTREHLGILLAMDLPTIVAITKTDMVSEERVQDVERDVEELLRQANRTPLPVERHGVDSAINEISESVVPIIRTSAVQMNGFDTLDKMFATLPSRSDGRDGPFSMYIDRTYTVEGVGAVATGTIRRGTVRTGDDLLIGPMPDGEFVQTRAQSIEIHYHSTDSAHSGQLVSVSVSNIREEDINRGMMLMAATETPKPVRKFEAEVMVLNHPTSITDGYEPVVHLETVSETAVMQPDKETLLPGDTGTATMRFKFNPYYLEEGQRFVFREGSAKGVGTVTSVSPVEK